MSINPTLKTKQRASQVALLAKNLAASAYDTRDKSWVQSLAGEDLLEEGMATHSGLLTGKIPWTEEPGGLRSIGLRGVKRD